MLFLINMYRVNLKCSVLLFLVASGKRTKAANYFLIYVGTTLVTDTLYSVKCKGLFITDCIFVLCFLLPLVSQSPNSQYCVCYEIVLLFICFSGSITVFRVLKCLLCYPIYFICKAQCFLQRSHFVQLLDP